MVGLLRQDRDRGDLAICGTLNCLISRKCFLEGLVPAEDIQQEVLTLRRREAAVVVAGHIPGQRETLQKADDPTVRAKALKVTIQTAGKLRETAERSRRWKTKS